jgi:hypothetical protein
VDDTGARHARQNGFCTQIGNDSFTWFGTRASKSRLNFFQLLRVGHTDYVINDVALSYMRGRALAGPVINQLAAQPRAYFANQVAWQAHLARLGISALHVTPDPVQIASEGTLWGSIHAHGFLREAVARRWRFPITRYGCAAVRPAGLQFIAICIAPQAAI